MTRDQVDEIISEYGDLIAGRTVFERLPTRDRPAWGSRLLHAASTCIDQVPNSVEQVERLASGPSSRWAEGHVAFQVVRGDTMRLDKKKYGGPGLTSQEERLHNILVLAEFVAKVTYNSTQPEGGFDEESGWNILPVIRDLISVVEDTDFESRLWSALLQC